MARLFFIVNEDRFFLSHRLPIAISAREMGFEVYIIAKDTGCKDRSLENNLNFINLPINPVGMNLFQELKTFFFIIKLYSNLTPDIVHHVWI